MFSSSFCSSLLPRPSCLQALPIDKTVLYVVMIAGTEHCHDFRGVGSDGVSIRRHVTEGGLPTQPQEEQKTKDPPLPRETQDCHLAPPEHSGRDTEGQGGHDAHQEGPAGCREALQRWQWGSCHQPHQVAYIVLPCLTLSCNIVTYMPYLVSYM